MSSLIENTLFGQRDIVGETIEKIQKTARSFTYCLRFSGGKDSIVTRRLFELAGVPVEIRFSRTSVDPPELLSYISKYHSDVIVEKPQISMFQLIVKKGFPPTRVCRYCCSEFKERNTCPKGDLFLTATGVRNQESKARAKRKNLEICFTNSNVRFFHPILDWRIEQIWDFIELEKLPYPSLYDEGFDRVGCVGCPLSSTKNILREFARWPKFEKAYLYAFGKMLEGRSFDKWKTPSDVMNWYVYGVKNRYKELEGQMDISMYAGDYYEQRNYESQWDTGHNTVEAAKKLLVC